MADKLSEVLSKFALCSEKKRGTFIELGDLIAGVSECHKSLIGMVYREKVINFTGMKNFALQIWNYPRKLHVSEIKANCFQFIFADEDDLLSVLNGVPWIIDNQLLMLKRWKEGIEDDKEMFKKAFLWVQPLFGGAIVKSNGIDKWLSFKYEKCPDFCYKCDRIGHDLKVCNLSITKTVTMKTCKMGPGRRKNHRKGIDVARLAVPGAESQLSSPDGGTGNLVYKLGEGSSKLNKINTLGERRANLANGQLQMQNVSLEVINNLPTAMDEDTLRLYGKENIHVDNLIETPVHVVMDKGKSKVRRELLKRYKKGKGVNQRNTERNPLTDVSNILNSEFDLGKGKVFLIELVGEEFESN
ncbi:hypothetical protein ACH5RR_025588 [Cinchona calisaya]|uniref:CCHC-type domain-containing protein n=1 Tax=Cinchona calisaya TaxID=153742 RepID=A0ABD2Z030_9GENT